MVRNAVDERRNAPPPAAPVEEPTVDDDDDDEFTEDDWKDPTRHLLLEGVDPRWLTFLDAISPQAPGLAGTLEHGHPVVVDDEGITLVFKNELHEANAQAADKALIEKGLSTFENGSRFEVSLAPSVDEELPVSVAQSRRIAIKKADEALRHHAENHPVVAKALALFGGRLKGVKRA